MGLPSVNSEVVPSGEAAVVDASSSIAISPDLPSLADRLFVSGFAAANLLLIRVILCGTEFPALHPDLERLWGISSLLLGALALLFCLPPLLVQSWKDLSSARFSLPIAKSLILLFASIATLNAAFIEPSAYQGQLILDELAVLCFLLVCEEYAASCFEARLAKARAFDSQRLATQVLKLEPYPDHAPVETPVEARQLKVGELFKLAAQSLIPCDGLVVEGMAEVYERRFSGAGQVKLKHKGDKVFSGSKLLRGEVLCEVTNVGSDSLISNFTDVLEKSVSAESKVQPLSETWQTRLGIGLLFVSFSSAAYAYGVGAGLTKAATIAAEVMVICLCTRLFLLRFGLAQIVLLRSFFSGALLRAVGSLRALEGAKNLIVDVISPFPHEFLFVKSFRVVDERLERERLVSVILNLLGASDEQRDEAMATYLLRLVDSPELHRVSDLRTYEGRGLSGVVGGVDFTIGSEAFLIERGVQLQMNELVILQENEQAIYVAMRDEVVASFTLRTSALEAADDFKAELRSRGVRLLVCSSEPVEKVDRAGKLFALELSDVFGDLPPERYIEKMRGAGRSALLLDQQSNPSLAAEAAVRIAMFDQLRWDLSRGDVLLLREDIQSIAEIFKLRDTYRRLRLTNYSLLALAIGLAVVAAGLGLSSAGLAIALILLALTASYSLNSALMRDLHYSV